MRGSQRPRRRPPQKTEVTQQEELPMRRTRSSSKLPPLQRSNSGTFFVSQYSPWRRPRKSERTVDGQQAPLNSDERVGKAYNKSDYVNADQDEEEVNLDEDEDTFSAPIDTSQRRSRLMRVFAKTFRRIAVWLAIFAMINYRYWTGRIRFPLTCNLLGLRCPSWPVTGHVEDGFEPVVETFKSNFEDGLEVGASFAAFVGDRLVVELYGGYHDIRYNRQYDESALQLVFSSSKFVESLVMTYLVDKGLIKYEDKIATYWPEFAQGNKENVTLSELLGHRAGVTYLDRAPTFTELADLDQLAILLAAQPHNFNGKSVQGYHAVTRGWYLNELVRRIDSQKRTLGQIIRQDIMPLLDVEFYLGIPQDLEHRISPLVGYPALRTLAKMLVPSRFLKEPLPAGFASVLNMKSVGFKATAGSNPKQIRLWPHTHNRREIWGSEGPSYGGITNAVSLAKFAALVANKGQLGLVRLISPEAIQRSLEPLPWMPDTVVTRNVTFTQGGWGLGFKFPGSDLEWYGWGGVGGSMVFFNPQTSISFSYVMNSMTLAGIGDTRSFSLIAQLVKCVRKIEKSVVKSKASGVS